MSIPNSASADGRGFAINGGFSGSELYQNTPLELEIKVEHAEGLDNCRKKTAKAHAYESEYEMILPELEE